MSKAKTNIDKNSSPLKSGKQMIAFGEADFNTMTTTSQKMEKKKYNKAKGKDLREITKKEEKINSEKQITSFDFALPVYMQIHIGNIYPIFGSAIITPSIYLKSKAFPDPQTLFPRGLVLCNNLITEKHETGILLELTITQEEQQNAIIEGVLAFYPMPLAISRIKRIYVSNEAVKKEILVTAKTTDGGIIPNDLIIANFPTESLVNPSFIALGQRIENLNLIDYSAQLKQYDRILGTFAFLKNYSFLLTNRLDITSVLPEHYFLAIQAINNASEFKLFSNDRIVSFYKQLFGLQNGIESPLLKWLFERIKKEKNFGDDDIKEFGTILFATSKSADFSTASKEILNDLAKSLERKNTIKKISNLQDAEKFSLYLFALLRTYGNVNTEDKTISRMDIPEFISTAYGEYVFALLGYFYGYNTLRNYDERLNLPNTFFAKNVNNGNRISIKFDLETLFDYVIIESVYRIAFLKQPLNNDIGFIESASIKEEKLKIIQSNSGQDIIYRDIYGKTVYQIKRKASFDEEKYKWEKMPDIVPVISELGAYCFKRAVPMYSKTLIDILGNKDDLAFIFFFKKEEIINSIRNGKLLEKDVLQLLEYLSK